MARTTCPVLPGNSANARATIVFEPTDRDSINDNLHFSPTVIGRMISQMLTVPSEEVDAKIASFADSIIPEMHVTPFLCGCGTVKTYFHFPSMRENSHSIIAPSASPESK
uniref:Uncharacterized protein n=1 Tax=Opuntia streptacantha TaxID=393608 RepID=A0A7C9A282_OPUST